MLNRTEAASLLGLAAFVVLAPAAILLVACGAGDEATGPREMQPGATETPEARRTQPPVTETRQARATQPPVTGTPEARETQPATAEASEQPNARLGVSEPEIVFLGVFSEEEKAAITQEVKSVQASYAERFGVATSEFTLYISSNFEALNEAFLEWLPPEHRRPGAGLGDWLTCGGISWPGAIFISLEACSRSDWDHAGPFAQEYFHVLQHDLGLVLGPSSQIWPTWLIEASADYASAYYAEEQGRGTVAFKRETALLAWSGLGRRLPGPYDGGDGIIDGFTFRTLIHDVGFLAVEWLVDRKGEEALIEFFRVGGGRHDFAKAFDMTADEFVAAFEEHRLEVAPPFEWRMAGLLLDADGEPIAYARIETLVTIEGAWASAGWADTNSRGEFELYGPGTGHRLGVFLKCTIYGPWIFAGQFGRGGFVVDANQRWDAEDEPAEAFAEEEHRTGIVIHLAETEEALLSRHCRR